MKTLRNLLLIVIGLFAGQFAKAQGTMKDPVSFTLKNGLTVIVAENTGISKVYTSFKIEDESAADTTQTVLQGLISNLFNTQASESDARINEVKAFDSNQINLSKAYLTIAGNITPSAAKSLAQKAFGDWKGNTAANELTR